MAKRGKMFDEVKWAQRQRLQFIEIHAFYTGAVSRSDVASAFAISDAAATKDLKFYNDAVPGNLVYQHTVFGFVPTAQFEPVFADLSPEKVLPVIEANLTGVERPGSGAPLFSIPVADLNLPRRLPDKRVLAPITRAIVQRKKLKVSYRSLSEKTSDENRVIEPHALVNTGYRWHVRAYNEASFDFRDFVLSRFASAELLTAAAESAASYDDDWVEPITVRLAPHPGLSEAHQRSLLLDYGSETQEIELTIRRALLGYLLQQLSVDTTEDFRLNPRRYQLVVTNRDEIEPFASWAFQ